MIIIFLMDYHRILRITFFCQYVSIFVKIDNGEIDKWRLKFFESMGGKTHVKCQCCDFPLIPSNKVKVDKDKCNVKKSIQGNDNEIQTLPMCTKKESFVCSNVNCQMRVCNKCYKTFLRTV